MQSNRRIFFVASLVFLLSTMLACRKTEPKTTTAYELVRPYKFPLLAFPEDSLLTKEGIQLGRMLFYDPILSGDSTMSCATCHQQKDGFSDKRKFSIGIDGSVGDRQAMPIINIAWMNALFWDGRAKNATIQALEPVENPLEMKANWGVVVDKLKRHATYPALFDKAFPDQEITKDLAAEAIAMFQKTLISSNSKFDLFLKGQYQLSPAEQRGYDLFFSEQADCFHCHSGALATDMQFHNNGLDAVPTDRGLERITKNPNDRGKFKTPTLRNIAKTAPYMHDGRFSTLDEVLDFYSEGVQVSPTTDALMEFAHEGGVHLTAQEKADLKAYLLLFTDEDFLTNPDFGSPF